MNEVTSDRLVRLRQLSRVMAVLCALFSVLLIAGMLAYWLLTPAAALLAQAGVPSVAPDHYPIATRLVGFAISMVPLGALIVGLLGARRTFGLFAVGQVFSVDAVRGLKRLAIAVACSAVLRPVAGAALSVLLSWTVAGQKSLVLNVGSDTLLALLFAGTVAVMAWVMAEAVAISEENAQFV